MEQIDWFLSALINQQMANPYFDAITPMLREPKFWIPAYLGLLFFIGYRYKLNALWIIAALLFTFGLTDQISSHVIKPLFERLRPCNNPALKEQVRLLVQCGSGFSFTSSHATNHFGMATVLSFFLGRRNLAVRWLFYIWAASIAFSQVYVGVHFLADVVAGAFLGFFLAKTVLYLANRYLLPFKKAWE